MVEVKGLLAVWQIKLDLDFHRRRNRRQIPNSNHYIQYMIYYIVSLIFIVSIEALALKKNCPEEHFILPALSDCHRWLNCSEIRNINIMNNIGYGTIKNVFKSNWRGNIVSVSILKHKKYLYDFNAGLNMLKLLNSNSFIVQLVGFCHELNIIVTEYHRFNNAINLKYLIKDSLSALKLCLNYAQILDYLHNNKLGTLVNCDSNTLHKLLSQLLITNDLNIVLADLDSIEIVKNSTVTCGSNSLQSNNNIDNLFMPPEQINYGIFNDKSEIWKVPDVCQYFINSSNDDLLKYLLFDVHKLCKSDIADRRPSAQTLINKYRSLLNDSLLTL
ncbi:hypothetical protein O3M35_004358 [Rhynocoris fuscipes]|uniref:Protein O-mannose kinase n=1 Tax=Rhynocoris fuscipes TaxID=488301 RepID=A0AAW1CLI0_9HEMI